MRARLRPPFLPPSDTASSPSTTGEGHEVSPSSSTLPPTLPPINRVTSPNLDIDVDLQRHVDAMSTQSDSRPTQSVQRSPYTGSAEPGFIGGVALRNYRRDLQAQAEAHAQAHAHAHAHAHAQAQVQSQPQTQQTQNQLSSVPKQDIGDGFVSTARPSSSSSPSARHRPVPAPIDTNVASRPSFQTVPQPYKPSSSFVAPTDIPATTHGGATGRRPPGVRLHTEPPAFTSNSATTEPQKTKKSLPFLRNPMSSLLMRRKNSQNAPDPAPLPLRTEVEEPVYDPRIKGTRIHDFSAPRRRDPVSKADGPPAAVGSQANSFHTVNSSLSPNLSREAEKSRRVSADYNTPKNVSAERLATPSHGQPQEDQQRASNDDRSSFISRASLAQRRRPHSYRIDSTSSMGSHSTMVSRASETTLSSPPRPANSVKTSGSRPVSMSSEMSARAIPRHMKSTSSRFSFDMIGAANEEKILEERHRQREAERKEAEAANPRHSGYDEYDDEFDYDAMMDDDGLEERIPGVNADYEEEEEEYYMEDGADPDNDQENFAGFVFQRSNVTTALPTPQSAHPLPTPRDVDGNVIGFAETQGSPFRENGALSPGVAHGMAGTHDASAIPAGLGIHHAGLRESSGSNYSDYKDDSERLSTEPRPRRGPDADEDLYFDDGIVGYEDEFAEDLASIPDGEPFDETLFDNNDTDQYGRPIAGAFAQAQAQAHSQTLVQGHTDQHELSGLEGVHSTEPKGEDVEPPTASAADVAGSMAEGFHHPAFQHEEPSTEGYHGEAGDAAQHPMVAYQAALAEAAHKAAASGKFQWGSSPKGSGKRDNMDYSPDDEEDMTGHAAADWDDGADFGYENMDDFELDDDAIIAEANASALENDSDGWYGQEFGFYSASVNQHSANTGSYHYSNGGVFAPKGMNGLDRSTSGRVVSREPNLTPITERSEYSNRNSLMSLGVPGQGFGTPIQSPGLAQLAMMADYGADDISLSGLLRLRSKAWGTSQASLSSSREGSPKSDRGDLPSAPWAGHGHARHSRSVSAVSNLNTNWEQASVAERAPAWQDLSSSAPAQDSYAMSRDETWSAPPAGYPMNRISLSAVGSSHLQGNRDLAFSSSPEQRRGHGRQSSADSMQ